MKDLIRGVVSFPNKTLDDQILLKSDGFPTYHWACVVDDHLMRVSHVVRGEEWLTSTPKHLILYRMRGWEAPRFAHLPLLLKPDGSKLSKRHDDSSLDWYVARGYLPEAVVNFVALLGWNPGSTQEVFTMQQLIESFRVERIQKAGAVVNRDKLDWFNQQHIGIMARERMGELVHLVKPKILAHHRPTSADATQTSASDADLADESFLRRILASLASHVTHVHDFVSQSLLFYCPPRLDDPASDAPIHALRAKVYPDEAATQLNRTSLCSTARQPLPLSCFCSLAHPLILVVSFSLLYSQAARLDDFTAANSARLGIRHLLLLSSLSPCAAVVAQDGASVSRREAEAAVSAAAIPPHRRRERTEHFAHHCGDGTRTHAAATAGGQEAAASVSCARLSVCCLLRSRNVKEIECIFQTLFACSCMPRIRDRARSIESRTRARATRDQGQIASACRGLGSFRKKRVVPACMLHAQTSSSVECCDDEVEGVVGLGLDWVS